LHELLQKVISTLARRHFIAYIILAFIAGCLCTGLFFTGQRSGSIGKFDTRYDRQHRGATEIIGRLEEQLTRERELNRQLREHNNRARELTEGLTDSAERNVRNLQDAVAIISEIRTKLKVLENFYVNSSPGNSID